MHGGQVYEFKVPTDWLNETEARGGVQFGHDSLQGTSSSAPEWRFKGKFSLKLNEYLVSK